MNKTIEIIDPTGSEKWDKFISHHEYGNLYHTSVWADIIISCFKYKPLYYTLNSQSEIIAAVPLFFVNSKFTGRRFVSVPFADYADLLYRDKADIDILMDRILKDFKKYHCKYIEIRTLASHSYFDETKFHLSKDYVKHCLNLHPPLDEIKENLHRSHIRKSIRKAESFNLKFVESEDTKDFNLFYELNMKNRVSKGLPPMPYAFLKNVWMKLKDAGAMKLFLVYWGDIPIAGFIMANINNIAYALYSGSDEDHLLKRPNHFMYWNAIKQAKEENYSRFDFGRSSVQNTGLIDFKKNWGTQETAISTFWYAESNIRAKLVNRKEQSTDSIANKIIKRLPYVFLKRLSKMVYGHLG